ncbi:MAG: amino acid transporter permease [Oscillospiraceae bacterium]|jgi:His/Glu/Gln/Arg/opine family amino acid ABC transporter permease subunit|nr:amino acid transporter permease [Oscillospiraceae bacterium]
MNIIPLNFFNEFYDGLYKTFIEKARYELFLEGLFNTVIIAIGATVIGVLIGVIVAILKVYTSQKKANSLIGTIVQTIVDKFLSLYLTVIRGTPIVVQLLIGYTLIFTSVQNGVPIAILIFGLNSGAYVAEIVRGGILSVDKGQMEAGRSLGLTNGATMKSIILPQAIKNILPAIGNEFIALLKETSVVGYVAVVDLTKAAKGIQGVTFDAFFPYLSIASMYLIMVIGLSALFKKLERRMARSDRR